MKNKKFLSPFLAVSIFVVVLMLDLLTKEFIIKNLIPNVGDMVGVIPGFINFVYVKNTGAAWGMLAGRPVFLIVLSLIVIGLLIAYYVLRLKKTDKHSSVWFGVSMGLIAGGCFGNLVDKIAFGYVRDFINFEFISFPVFNFADVALTIGVITMIIYFLFFYSKEEKLVKKDKEKGEFQTSISLSTTPDLTPVDENKDNDGGDENER